MPKVSVIIPNYNYARYLDERIQSVLNQTYRDFEVIILDDCSTDNSREVIDKYRDSDKVSRIVYNDKNSGSVFRQWSKGMSMAAGEYIWIAESDDVAEPDFLEKMMDVIGDDKSVAFAACDITEIDGNGVPFATWGISDATEPKIHDGRQFIRDFMIYDCYVLNASSAVFRKDMALAVPDDYTKMKASGDYMFWIELANQGRVAEVPFRLDRFRRHSGCVTFDSQKSGITFSELYEIYKRLLALRLIGAVDRYKVVGMRLWRMRLAGVSGRPELQKVLGLWRGAVRFPDLALMLYLAYALVVRVPSKKFLYKKREDHSMPRETSN